MIAEAGYINDYSYLEDAGKSYDNRWMHLFRQLGPAPGRLYDHWGEKYYAVGADHEHLEIAPYGFLLLEVAG
jgi:hypothetical protein